MQLKQLLERLMRDHEIAGGVHPGYRTMTPENPGDIDDKGR
jgi:hypothetical protein